MELGEKKLYLEVLFNTHVCMLGPGSIISI